jgi:hypothetical protein
MFRVRNIGIGGIALLLMASSSGAQVVDTTPGNTYVAVVEPDLSHGGVCDPIRGFCVSPDRGIPLNFFTNAVNFQPQIDQINNRLSVMDQQISVINNRLSVMDQQISVMNGQVSRLFELTAISAAMKDAIPNYGDRFAIRINAAAFEGQGAAALGFGYNVTSSVRASLNYGQSRSQGIVSGGLNFSFH